MHQLTLYSRDGCHLCEEMEQQLSVLEADLGFSLNYVDVDSRPELAALYGARIPVLALGDEEICQARLNEDSLRAALM